MRKTILIIATLLLSMLGLVGCRQSSPESYIPYDDSGKVYDSSDDRLIKIPIYYMDEEEPCEYLITNVLNLNFFEHISIENRKRFITETLGGKVIGYLNAVDMMQVMLPNPITNANTVGYDGETNLDVITEKSLLEYKDKIVTAYSDILDSIDLEYIHINMTDSNSLGIDVVN